MSRKAVLIATLFLVLLADQSLKIWIKTNLSYGDEFGILGLSWARIHFVENEGMAFGISFGGKEGKLALSLFRIAAITFLFYILWRMIRENEPKGLIFSFTLILAGAIGNMLDSAFYGMIFSASPYHGGLAEMLPENGGYAGFLHGRVVDMFYFPLIDTILPEWFPFWGGERFQFFKPVFNIADSSITIGVLSILLFHRRYFSKSEKDGKEEKTVLGWEGQNGEEE